MQLAEFKITKEFFEEDKRINVYIYPYGKRICIDFYISNFKNPSVYKHHECRILESIEDTEKLLEVYPSHNHLIWNMLTWLHFLSNTDIYKDDLFDIGNYTKASIGIVIPNFFENTELHVSMGSCKDEAISFRIVNQEEKRFLLIDLFEGGNFIVNNFNRYNIQPSFLPFREEEHNRLLGFFNASLKEILEELKDFVSKLDIEEWLSEVTFPTSGGRNKE